MYIEINNLWKTYSGHAALKGISLQIEQGKVLGILGENGAGKSSLFRILANVSRPTQGSVTIQGIPVGQKTREMVAYLPEIDPYDTRMTARELFEFLSVFFPRWNMMKALELLEFMKLDEQKKIKTLSKGQKVRLKIVCTFAQNGELILMDEPLGGIDPVSRKKVMETIFNELKFGEQTIIIATHLVEDVEEFLEDVVYLREGEIALAGNSDQLREEYQKSLIDLFEEVLQ